MQKPGPHGLRSSLERVDIAVLPFHRPRSVCFPTASLEIRRDSRPNPLSSTSSPASAIPQCCHHFGFEQQAQIAFRPCRFTRLRRVSPPIARVLTELFVTLHSDEGLAGLLRPAANRRVRCVSFTHPVEPAPEALPLLTPFLAGHSDLRFPASTFVPPGGFPPLAAGMRFRTPSVHVAMSLASSDFPLPFNPRPSR